MVVAYVGSTVAKRTGRGEKRDLSQRLLTPYLAALPPCWSSRRISIQISK